MSCPFSQLPLEVLAIILQHAPDLPSIYKLICASASANTAFKLSPASILDPVLERSIPEFKHLARMVAILGSFSASSAHPTFENLVDKYNNDLPKDVLTTAPASFAFVTGTPGPRYLVLTAYRIEILQHICFVSLLQNIHEVICPVASTSTHKSTKKTKVHPIKQSKDNIPFYAAAWWSPSWVEKMRIMRALWKLMIYWNIRAISSDLMNEDDYIFSQYSAKIEHISPCIGPDLTSLSNLAGSTNLADMRDFTNRSSIELSHEVEEMKCVLAATHEFLSCADSPGIPFAPFTRQDIPKFRFEEWTSSTIFKETSHWRVEDPKPVRQAAEGFHNGQTRCWLNKINSGYRLFFWYFWFNNWRPDSEPKLYCYDHQFPDYLGLCIWDYKRQGYFGLAYMDHNSLDTSLRPLRNFESPLFTKLLFPERWRSIFKRELFRSFGGKIPLPPSESMYIQIEEWYCLPFSPMLDIDGWRKCMEHSKRLIR